MIDSPDVSNKGCRDSANNQAWTEAAWCATSNRAAQTTVTNRRWRLSPGDTRDPEAAEDPPPDDAEKDLNCNVLACPADNFAGDEPGVKPRVIHAKGDMIGP